MAQAGSKSVFLPRDPRPTSRISVYWTHLRILQNSLQANP
jgi:hypothetical protein